MVGFQFRRPYAVSYIVLLKYFIIIIKDNCCNAFVLVFRVNANKIENHIPAVLFCLKQVDEPKRKQFAIGLYECFRERRHYNGKCNNIFIFVYNKLNVIRINKAYIFFLEILLL